MTPRTARLLTNVGAPWLLNAVGPLGLSAALGSVWWGLWVSLIAGLLPLGLIGVLLVRRQVSDVHVRNRGDRSAVIAGIIAVVVLGLVAELVGQAPRWTVAVTAAGLVTIMGVGAVTVGARYKVSVHTAVGAGWVVLAAMLVSPWALAALPLVAPVGWSRVVLRDHTVGQTLWGAVMGAALSAVTIAVLGP